MDTISGFGRAVNQPSPDEAAPEPRLHPAHERTPIQFEPYIVLAADPSTQSEKKGLVPQCQLRLVNPGNGQVVDLAKRIRPGQQRVKPYRTGEGTGIPRTL